MLLPAKFDRKDLKLSKNELLIYEFIQKNPSALFTENIEAAAERLEISPSALTRFAKRFGYKGFPQLKMDLMMHVSLLKEKENNFMFDLEDDFSTFLQKEKEFCLEIVKKTFENIEVQALEKVIHSLSEAKQIFLVGVGNSGQVCEDLYTKLLRFGLSARYSKDSHLQISGLSFVEKTDAVLAISYSGESKEILSCVELAKEKGAKVIALTQKKESALAKLADFTLLLPPMETALRIGAIASRNASLIYTDLLLLGIYRKRAEYFNERIIQTRIAIENYKKK